MMQESRRKELLAGQTSVAQKIYNVVPIDAQWTVDQIYTEMRRAGIATASASILRACLQTLREAGLIEGSLGNGYRRVPVKATVPVTVPPAVRNAILDDGPLAEPEPRRVSVDPIDMLAEIVDRLNVLSHDVQNIALAMQARIEARDADVSKLTQLRALLRDV